MLSHGTKASKITWNLSTSLILISKYLLSLFKTLQKQIAYCSLQEKKSFFPTSESLHRQSSFLKIQFLSICTCVDAFCNFTVRSVSFPQINLPWVCISPIFQSHSTTFLFSFFMAVVKIFFLQLFIAWLASLIM